MHPEGVGELLLRQGGPHHHDHVAGHFLELTLFAGLQAEGERVGLAEKVLQPQLALLLGLGIHEHMVAEARHRLQALLVALQKVLQLGQELLPLGDIAELEDEVVVFQDANHDHRLAVGVLGHLDNQGFDVLDADRAELLALAVEQVEGLVGAELDLDRPAAVLVEPLLHVHLVGLLAVVVVLLSDLFHLSTSAVHQLDHGVGKEAGQKGNKAKDNAPVNIGGLASLKTNITLHFSSFRVSQLFYLSST